MSVTTVTAVNLTVGPLALVDLGETLPASGSLLLSGNHKGFEIFSSEDLFGEVSAGQVVMDIGGGPLSTPESIELFTRVNSAAETAFDGVASGSAETTVQGALDEVLTSLSSSNPRRASFQLSVNSSTFFTLTTCPFDTLGESEGAAFTLTSPGVIRCDEAGSYRVFYDASMANAVTSGRSGVETALYLNGVEVPGTQRFSYHREVGTGSQSVTGRAVLDLVSSDTLEVRTVREHGSDSFRFLASGCTLSIEAYTGGPGLQGPQGLQGAGASTIVEDEGVDISPGDRFHTYNFPLGCAVQDSGSQINITPGLPGVGIKEIAGGSTLGLEQTLKAQGGQIGKTVLAVGYTYYETDSGPSINHRAQIASLGNGNVVFVYATGADFTADTVQEGPIFLSLGEVYVIENVQPGTIITASEGAYGCSQQFDNGNMSPMPLLSLALAFQDTFFYGFRNSANTDAYLHVVCGPLAAEVSLADGSGSAVLGQTSIALESWEHRILQLDGNQEYRLTATAAIMACVNADMNDSEGGGAPRFYDSRLVLPLSNEGITWPRSGFMSAPYTGTDVRYRTNDNVTGTFTVSPGTPINISTVTGANDSDYEPAGATRFNAVGLVSAYSGADSAGLEATPFCPTEYFTQRIALPLRIDNAGDGGNNGIALASNYEGTARLYQWNQVTGQADLVSVQQPGTGTLVTEIPITRRIGGTSTREHQNYPASASIVRGVGTGGVDPESHGFTGEYLGGYIEVSVPCCCVFNSEQTTTTFRGTSGPSVVGIQADDDEQLSFGITPEELRTVIRQGEDGLLYRQVITAGGFETWTLA